MLTLSVRMGITVNNNQGSDIKEYFSENIFSVTQINECVKEVLDAIPVFSSVRIRGEISNFKNHVKSGHLYFSLKDENSVIKAVMFSRDAHGLNFRPEDGMKVVACGRISAYTRDGVYQLYVSEMEADGRGELYAAFERLKKRLEEEGVFSERYKKPLPRYPKTVGVITSQTGAAVRDIINITGRRWPVAQIAVWPALVQGEGAVSSLIDGVQYMTEVLRPDVVIIGRGGGSIEDLWAFNSEKLARAMIASDIPFISGVGHETDFTICDFAASVRAPTPSGAAEIAVPDIEEERERFERYRQDCIRTVDAILKRYNEKLAALSQRRVLSSPYGFIDERRMRLDRLSELTHERWKRIYAQKNGDFERLCGKLNALSPLNVLERGYGAVYFPDGSVVSGVSELEIGDALKLGMSDGEADVQVTGVKKRGRKCKRKKQLKGREGADNAG